MLDWIDNFLNKITMYRLVLYFMFVLVGAALVLSFIPGLMPFGPLDLIIAVMIFQVVSWASNLALAHIFKVPANVESVYITAFILCLIITPSPHNYLVYIVAAVVGQASKYFLAYKGKHIFNPAALAVVVTSLAMGESASWWVGTAWMLPVVAVGGLLVLRKVQRVDLALSFFLVAVVSIILKSSFISDPLPLLNRILLDTPIVFFTTIMLIEPLTTPPNRSQRFIYGVLTGVLFGPTMHVGTIYSTPELALAVANIYSYLASPKGKFKLTLKAKQLIGLETYELVFETKSPLRFRPGQYLEWTLGHTNPDNRGNRRYFTVASSPTEKEVRLGVKFYDKPSTFKQKMHQLVPGSQIMAGQLMGDFTLPRDPKEKLVFIAGGIGITPFRSILKYLMDRGEKRDIVLFYSNKKPAEVAYREILDEAQAKLGIKTIYIMTDETGYLTGDMITRALADYRDRKFYISGPRSMVVAFEQHLEDLAIPKRQIKTDFFPGYA